MPATYSHRLLLFIVPWLILFSSCAHHAMGDEWIPAEDPMASEGVIACSSMIQDFHKIDADKATEEELEAAMSLAIDSYERCKRQFELAGKTKEDRAINGHRAEEIYLHSLYFESALSRRFDHMAGYCDILKDILKTLALDIQNMEEELATLKFSEQQQKRMRELQLLDMQSLELVGAQMRLACLGERPEQLRQDREKRKEEIQRQLNQPQQPSQKKKR